MRLLRVSALMVCLLLGAVLLLGVVSLRAAPRGGGVVPIAPGTGDLNCDGRTDIADPIYLLSWLFTGGPEPCAAQAPDPCCPAQVDQLKALSAAVEAQGAKTVEIVEQLKRLAAAAERSAPPKPGDIVNLTLRFDTKAIASGVTEIYAVPQNRALIVTDFGNTFYNYGLGVEVVEVIEDTITAKMDSYFGALSSREIASGSFSPRTGLAFCPGSKLALRNLKPDPVSGVVYLHGYLADP